MTFNGKTVLKQKINEKKLNLLIGFFNFGNEIEGLIFKDNGEFESSEKFVGNSIKDYSWNLLTNES